MNIALRFMGGEHWQAGSSYLYNLFYALKSASGAKHKLILYSPAAIEKEQYQVFSPLISSLSNNISDAECLIEKAGYSSHLLKNPEFNLPIISWIWDFQHKELPEMFSKEYSISRDEMFAKASAYSKNILLSNNYIKQEYIKYYPSYAHKAKWVAIPSSINHDSFKVNASLVIKNYALPEKFIFMPCQFWKHKNHKIVVEAVSIAKKNGSNITIVLCGNKQDFRHPQYINELDDFIKSRNLENNFIYLGMIKYGDLIQIMRCSLAVLQPSLYEGWSLTVEEANTLGKYLILSNIPTHTEKYLGFKSFFNPADAETLSQLLINCYREIKPGPDIAKEKETQEETEERINKSGKSLLNIILETADN